MANITIIKRMIPQLHKAIQQGNNTRAAEELAYRYEVKPTKKQRKLHQLIIIPHRQPNKRWHAKEVIHPVNEQGELIAPTLQAEQIYKLVITYKSGHLMIKEGITRKSLSTRNVSRLIKNEGFISKQKFIEHYFPPRSSNKMSAQLVCWEDVHY